MMGKRSRKIHNHGAQDVIACSSLILVVFWYLSNPIGVRADVTWSGDIDPADPTTWTSSTYGYIGKTGNGMLNINNGSDVLDRTGYIGYDPGSTGEVTVDGVGSTWTNSSGLLVGWFGSGSLNITGGGTVSNNSGYIGYITGSTGECTVDGLGSMWTNSSSFYVGHSGYGTLYITGGGTVSNSSGYIGYYSGSTGEVTVDGTYSSWMNSSDLYVGGSGSGTMNITGGGTVSSDYGIIGNYTDSLGQVTVDGSSSTWANDRDLYVGDYYGSGTMNITGGGAVSDRGGYIGYRSGSTGAVTVNGADSIWTNRDNLYIGESGNGTLNITNGGAVSNEDGYIGYVSGSTGEVTVNDPGSTWTNTGDLFVGNYGSGTLNITSGGEVTFVGDTWISCNSGSSGMIHFNNGILTTGGLLCGLDDLTGTGTINTNGIVSDVDLVFDAGHGLNQTFNINDNPGQNITVNLNVDGSGYYMGAGFRGAGTMSISDGRVINSTEGYIGFNTGSTGTVTVDGPGSTWTNTQNLWVGFEGSGTLNITDGGAVNIGEDTWLSYSSGSSGTIHFDNGILTTSSLLCGADDLTGTGTINTYGLVSDVDLVFDAAHGLNQTFNVNDNPGQNITVNLNVDGSGYYMGAGFRGAGTMSISDGRVIESTDGYIGSKAGSTGAVTIDGLGSTWTNSDNLYVGNEGNGTLTITGGGTVSSDDCIIGNYTDSTGQVTIDGADSTWTNSSSLYIGRYGSGTLNITDGGKVNNSTCSIGYWTGSTGAVTVDGPGSTWTNSGNLSIGWNGTASLSITNGGAVSNDWCNIDGRLGSTGEVTVDGSDSTWISYGSLRVGRFGRGIMNITDGGAVSNGYGYIGEESGSSGGVTVDGPGSTWTNSGNLFVGGSGIGSLNITGGGAVSNSTGYIGSSTYYKTCKVTVDGPGSTWMNSGDLEVGRRGIGSLNITSGGAVSSNSSRIGYFSGYTGEVTVDGNESRWMNNSDLYVGGAGSGTLNITDGGLVTVGRDTWVSLYPSSSGTIHLDNGTLTTGGLLCIFDDLTGTGTINTHGLVSDIDLVFDATHGLNRAFNIDDNPDQDVTINFNVDGSGSMGAGYRSVGTMSISDGKVIESTGGYIGASFDSTGVVTVDSPGSMWTNSDYLYVGHNGSGTLNITDGGTVSNSTGYIGYGYGTGAGATGVVKVDGTDSTWTNSGDLYIGRRHASGTLNITGDGLVSVAGTLTIDDDAYGDSFINMATGGMLALNGKADNSLFDFLGLIEGTDAIRYWDDSISNWTDITGATYGQDYTLSFLTEGDLAGYTLLTVPEPATLSLFALGTVAMLRRKRAAGWHATP